MNDYLQVMITIDSEKGAKELGRLLVELRAAACVQIWGPIFSTYRWEGGIQDAQEWICLAKTETSQYDRLESLIKENHPYDVPEILAFPIFTGNKEYLDWVGAEITHPA